MNKSIFVLNTLVILIYGCDCHMEQKGRILSNADEQPINNAQIKLKGTTVTVKTDSLGRFNLHYFGGGRCPKPVFVISKKEYKDFEIEFDYSESESIVKVKKGSKNYDLKGKYFYPDSTNLSTFFTSIEFDKYSKSFTIRNDSLIIYLDPDEAELDFSNYLKKLKSGGWNIDRSIIK